MGFDASIAELPHVVAIPATSMPRATTKGTPASAPRGATAAAFDVPGSASALLVRPKRPRTWSTEKVGAKIAPNFTASKRSRTADATAACVSAPRLKRGPSALALCATTSSPISSTCKLNEKRELQLPSTALRSRFPTSHPARAIWEEGGEAEVKAKPKGPAAPKAPVKGRAGGGDAASVASGVSGVGGAGAAWLDTGLALTLVVASVSPVGEAGVVRLPRAPFLPASLAGWAAHPGESPGSEAAPLVDDQKCDPGDGGGERGWGRDVVPERRRLLSRS